MFNHDMIEVEYIESGCIWRLAKCENSGGYKLSRCSSPGDPAWENCNDYDSMSEFFASLPLVSDSFLESSFFRYEPFTVNEIELGLYEIRGVDYGRRNELILKKHKGQLVTELLLSFLES